MKALTRWARAVPAAVAQVRANLKTPLPPTYADIGRTQFGGLASFLETDVPGVFAAVTDSALRTEFTAANAEAVRALKETDAWFAAERNRATGSCATGT